MYSFLAYLPPSRLNCNASALDSAIPVNWINALGTRLARRMFTPESLGKTFDWVHARLLKTFGALHEEEWERCGMYAPTQWDPVSLVCFMINETEWD